MNKITFGILLVLVLSLTFASAGIFDFLKKETKPNFNITDTFNIKIKTLDSSGICIKDGEKIVKDKQCEKEKPKYVWINVSNMNIYQNNEGVIRID